MEKTINEIMKKQTAKFKEKLIDLESISYINRQAYAQYLLSERLLSNGYRNKWIK